MIFNSLRINNYRAYYGESIFDFPTEGERNISILYADNDVGKSCFFSAVLFCLYGPKDSDNLKDLINVNAQSEKSYHAEVSLFVENGKDKFVLYKPLSKSKTCCINFEGSNLKSFLWRKAWRYIRIIFFFIFWFQV